MRAEVLAGLRDALDQALGVDDVEHRVRRRARERVAAERRRVRHRAARLHREARRRLLAARDRADRDAAAEALRERHHVGRDVVVLVAEPPAGAADAGLHLVEDQDRAGVVAQPAQPGEVARRRDDDAALGLDRLDDDRARGARLEHARRGFEIAVRDELDRADERAEALAVLRLAGDRRPSRTMRPWKLPCVDTNVVRCGAPATTAW